MPDGYPQPNKILKEDIFLGKIKWDNDYGNGSWYQIYISPCKKQWAWNRKDSDGSVYEENRRYIENGPNFLNPEFYKCAKPLLEKALLDDDPSISPAARVKGIS